MNTRQWADHLESIARPALRGTPLDPTETSGSGNPESLRSFVATFSDELGHRRAVDRPLLGRLLGIAPGAPSSESVSPDVRLWWALLEGGDPAPFVTPSPGPVIGEAEFARGAIEATTETELSALHALSHHAVTGRSSLGERVLDAARWHVDTLQPDNGTNHPWAVHVFLALAAADEGYAAGATLHAEGLLHNALVRTGRPDRFSACVLLDSARSLRTRADGDTQKT